MSTGLGNIKHDEKSHVPPLGANNVKNVRHEMEQKINYKTPYYANNNTVKKCITDFDVFPYTRWYRGVATSDNPIIIEREAGYRKVKQSLTEEQKNNMKYRYTTANTFKEDTGGKQMLGLNGFLDSSESSQQIRHCFEAACSTVYPCKEPLKAFNYKEGQISVNTTDKNVTISP
jgi:hypothetical protein